ncbi:MAG TPA: transporter substrate-binding domain-containing protein, partial [Azospira sp.]|nr:transporter substrate-binding domain-containing protein [Azospira sp.]
MADRPTFTLRPGAWRLLVLLAWSLCLLAIPLTGRAQNLSQEQKHWLGQHPEIRVGATEMPPLLMREFRSGSYSGLSVDLLKRYESVLGVRFQMVYYGSLEDMHEGIRNREIDAVFAAVPTPGRELYLAFPKPYAELETKIIVRRETLPTTPLTLDRLNNRTVAVLAASALEERLRREYPQIKLVPARDELATLTKLAFGEVDAAVTDLGRVTYYVQKEGLANLAVGGDTGIRYSFTFAVRNDWPELATLMDLAAGALPQEEKEQIQLRWLHVEHPSPWNNPRFWWVAGGMIALIVLTLGTMLLWNRALRKEVAARTTQLDAQMAELVAVDRDLRESEARFRDLAELSYDWYWEQDEHFRFTMMSGGAFQKGRLPVHEYLGKARWELPLLGVTLEQITAHRAQVENHLPYRDFTYQFRTEDGAIHWYIANGRPIFDDQGQFRGYRGTGQDITERMLTQQALIDSEQRIRGLLDSTFSFVGLMDPQGTLLEANRTSLEFAGLRKEDVV